MDVARTYNCAICGKGTTGDAAWLLLVNNRWRDKLKILHWQEHLARQPGVHPVCDPSHAEELVVHWMTTGSLDYPFARASSDNRRHRARRKALATAAPELQEVDTRGAQQIGELAIHRESMLRILGENPQALSAILEALLRAMQRLDVPPALKPTPELVEFLVPQEV